MTHYNTDYSKITGRKEKDDRAIKDIEEYLGTEKFKSVIEMVEKLKANNISDSDKIRHLNFAFGMMAGITGYPFHAFCRRYMLKEYRAWMADPSEGLSIQTDEEGHPVKS